MKFDFSNRKLFNDIYLNLLFCTKRYQIIYGGRDSGKSDFVAQRIIILMLSEPFFRCVLLRKFYENIKDSQFQTIQDYIKMWKLEGYFHITTSPLKVVCKINGNSIAARGLDRNEEATKSMKDITCCWYEEADQIGMDAFLETTHSIRSSRTEQYYEFLTFNPQREKCWINDYFFPTKQDYEKADGNFHWINSTQNNTVILHTNYKDNRFCTPERADILESLKDIDDNHYKVKVLGLWGGALKGLVFNNWQTCDDIPDGADIAFGLDFGFNNPSALVMVGHFDKNLYLKELLYTNGKTPDEIAQIIFENFKDLIGRLPIIVDSAEPSLIKALRNHKYKFNAIAAIKGPGSVSKGIVEMKNFQIYITSESFNLQSEFEAYIWKPSYNGMLVDEPVQVFNHLIDASRYVVQTYGLKHWKRIKAETIYKSKSRRTGRSRPKNDFF